MFEIGADIDNNFIKFSKKRMFQKNNLKIKKLTQ